MLDSETKKLVLILVIAFYTFGFSSGVLLSYLIFHSRDHR